MRLSVTQLVELPPSEASVGQEPGLCGTSSPSRTPSPSVSGLVGSVQ
ncbi:MAG: hypothetical protein PHS50_03720 [Kiritimatiellae bacterium]|nr:hypothetical protein [Kiritimatiellia bacterium]